MKFDNFVELVAIDASGLELADTPKFIDDDTVDSFASIIKALLKAWRDCQGGTDVLSLRGRKGARKRRWLTWRGTRLAMRQGNDLERDEARAVVESMIKRGSQLAPSEIQELLNDA